MASGSLTTSGGMSGDFTLYYVVQFLQPWSVEHVFSDGNAPSSGLTASGINLGAALDFSLTGKPVELRVGLSLVSIEGAKANLAAELAGASFDDDRATAENAWVNRLDVAHVFGGTLAQQAAFFSALHHAFVMPGVYNDSDGSYRAHDRHSRHWSDDHQIRVNFTVRIPAGVRSLFALINIRRGLMDTAQGS